MKNLFYYVYNNKMTTKVENVLKAPFTEGDYFHTTNPYYYGVKRPTLVPNLGKPFNHSPFLSQINSVGFNNLPKVPSIQKHVDARFDIDSRGWFQVNQPKNKPFWGSPFELQINGTKSDQAAPFYQANENVLNTETIQREVDLGTEIKSAETSRKFQEAVTFIPTIFQKISKFSNDKLSNPNLKITDYLTPAEQEYLNTLNKKSNLDIKDLITQIETLTGKQLLPTSSTEVIEPPNIDIIEPSNVEVIEPPEIEVNREPLDSEVEMEPSEIPKSPSSKLLQIQKELLINQIDSLRNTDIRKFMNKVKTIERMIDIIKDEYREERELRNMSAEDVNVKSKQEIAQEEFNKFLENWDEEYELNLMKEEDRNALFSEISSMFSPPPKSAKNIETIKSPEVLKELVNKELKEKLRMNMDDDSMPSLEEAREEEEKDDDENFLENDLRELLPEWLQDKRTFITEIEAREAYFSNDAVKYNSKGDLIVAYRYKKDGSLSNGINAETLYKRLKEGREFEYKDNKIILL